MGVSSGFLWAVLVICFGVLVLSQNKGYTICDVPGCNCTVNTKPWKSVNCSLDYLQTVPLPSDGVKEEIMEIFINGGQLLHFPSKTFNALPGLTLLHINGTKKIVMERRSFFNLSSSSLLIQIQNCDQLIIKTGAFDNMQSSLSTEIVNTGYVSIEKSAFSKLHLSLFQNIQQLVLSEGAFEFKGHGNIKRHGPVTELTFDNVAISKIPKEVFYSSLAHIKFLNSRIEVVESKAFMANEVAAVSIINTSIKKIEREAFHERTLINFFKISKSNISRIETDAVRSGVTKLIVMHSILTNIATRAIATSVASAQFIGNHVANFHSSSLVLRNWNTIKIEANIIKTLYSNFIEAPITNELGTENDISDFTFAGNEIYNIQPNALNFVPELEDKVLFFDDNLFKQLCFCSLGSWFEEITNGSKMIDGLLNSSYCILDKNLARCFNFTEDTVRMPVFMERACRNESKCEVSELELEDPDTTSRIWLEDEGSSNNSMLILIVALIGAFIIAMAFTFIVLLIRGSRWLQRKGYFRNIHYNHNEPSNEEENTIVTVDENEKLEVPEELTLEFLEDLSKRLDDPNTIQEATEMIEKLYEMFIIDDSYGGSHRQEEEAHLYEELGNLSRQIPPPPYEEQSSGPRNFLKIMEEKFKTDSSTTPQLTEYSEPTDAAVHLYSELKQKNNEKKDSLKSNSSGKMALRPLPDKPSLFQAGPSSSKL